MRWSTSVLLHLARVHAILLPVLKHCFLGYPFVVIMHPIFIFESLLRNQVGTLHWCFTRKAGNLRAKGLAMLIWINSWLFLHLILICHYHFLLLSIIISTICSIVVLVLISVNCLAHSLPIIWHAWIHHLSVLWQRGWHSGNIVMIFRIHLLFIGPAWNAWTRSNGAWNLFSISFHQLMYSNCSLLHFFVRRHLGIPFTNIDGRDSALWHLD